MGEFLLIFKINQSYLKLNKP